ncbi:MAG: phage tail tape measure protein, partial [Selenomonadaceae bacterium]|nr:phage tail tape measure protein [Selenomonadaceae bacterium]
MTFEHAMSRVKALTQSGLIRQGDFDAVNANMQKLEAQARELGATTQFTMTQAADAMGYLGMAGWKTEQIYGTMPGMLDLAAGAGTDLARTADIVSDNMTAMGIPVEKAGHFMDVYAYALTNANVNLESLGETMKYAAPVAAAFGATLEDTAAMTMMMGNAGIKGSMAGTALRMGLLRLSGPPKKATKEMEALGISVSDATAMALESQAALKGLGVEFDENAPPMEKMGNIIKQLQVKMKGLSREEKLASIGAIFGANAASGWVNIIEQGGDVFDNYRNALRNSDGYAKQFAKTMNDDTRGAMIALDSATDAVVNALGT